MHNIVNINLQCIHIYKNLQNTKYISESELLWQFMRLIELNMNAQSVLKMGRLK